MLSDAFLFERAAGLRRDFIKASQVNLLEIDPPPQKIWKPLVNGPFEVNVDCGVSKVKGCVGVDVVGHVVAAMCHGPSISSNTW